jgi:U3 small nucleolar RNA-associated protein 14
VESLVVKELEDEVDQKQMLQEAFTGDDVIKEFLEEKREAVKTNKPKDPERYSLARASGVVWPEM